MQPLTYYYDIKIFHVCAGALLVGVGLFCLLRQAVQARSISPQALSIATQNYRLAWCVLTPLAFLQALTAILIIAFRGYALNQTWLDAAFIGYMFTASTWLASLLCLKSQLPALAQLMTVKEKKTHPLFTRYQIYLKLQFLFAGFTLLSLFSIIFFMASATP